MAIERITIEFNEYMGQITMYTGDRENLQVCDLDYKSNLGEIVQEYYDEVR